MWSLRIGFPWPATQICTRGVPATCAPTPLTIATLANEPKRRQHFQKSCKLNKKKIPILYEQCLKTRNWILGTLCFSQLPCEVGDGSNLASLAVGVWASMITSKENRKSWTLVDGPICWCMKECYVFNCSSGDVTWSRRYDIYNTALLLDMLSKPVCMQNHRHC